MEESPYRRNGVTASPQTRHPLRETPDWEAAKNNTGGHGIENARRIIAQLWKPEFSEDVNFVTKFRTGCNMSAL